jgi:hypothetical protein
MPAFFNPNIMQTIHLAIISLSVLDISLQILVHWIDRLFYVPVKLTDYRAECFFSNTTFDERVNRFMISKDERNCFHSHCWHLLF